MYDELIRCLRGHSERYGCAYNCICDDASKRGFGTCSEELAKLAADAIEELSSKTQELPRWIPVTEQPPDVGERVLCYCRANIYEVMKMRADGDWEYDANHVYMHSFVTHWMKRPEPPREVKA